jgi:hypothetical protein
MSDYPRIPYVLWPAAIVYAFAVAYTVNVIERKWRRPQKSRPADWRSRLG